MHQKDLLCVVQRSPGCCCAESSLGESRRGHKEASEEPRVVALGRDGGGCSCVAVVMEKRMDLVLRYRIGTIRHKEGSVRTLREHGFHTNAAEHHVEH